MAADTMTDSDRWAALVEDWRAKQDAMLAFPLFERGMMRNDRLAEYERLRTTEREARERMDVFISALKASK